MMTLALRYSDLRDIYEKVATSERISEADAIRLFQSKDLNAVGAIADLCGSASAGTGPATS